MSENVKKELLFVNLKKMNEQSPIIFKGGKNNE
jgi:hypothetical protein